MELINFIYPDRVDMALAAIAAIPVGLVVYAFITKKPDSKGFVRRVWINGRFILIFSAVLKIMFIFVSYILEVGSKLEISSWLHIAVSIIIVVYLYFSQRVKDTFVDFPQSKLKAQQG